MFLATSPSPPHSSSYRSSNADSVLERSEHGSRSQALPHYRWSALFGLGRALVSDLCQIRDGSGHMQRPCHQSRTGPTARLEAGRQNTVYAFPSFGPVRISTWD